MNPVDPMDWLHQIRLLEHSDCDGAPGKSPLDDLPEQVEVLKDEIRGNSSMRVLRWRPLAGRPVIAKIRNGPNKMIETHAEVDKTRSAERAMEQSDMFRVPRILSSAPEHGIFTMEEARGTSLRRMVSAPDFTGITRSYWIERVARCFRQFHGNLDVGEAPFDSDYFVREAHQFAVPAGMSEQMSQDLVAAERVVEAIVEAATLCPSGSIPHVMVHGDANLTNILLTNDVVTLIDFEHAHHRSAMFDVAAILVRLESIRPAERAGPADMAVVSQADMTAFRNGYGDFDMFGSPLWRLHTAIAVGRLLQELSAATLATRPNLPERRKNLQRMIDRL